MQVSGARRWKDRAWPRNLEPGTAEPLVYVVPAGRKLGAGGAARKGRYRFQAKRGRTPHTAIAVRYAGWSTNQSGR